MDDFTPSPTSQTITDAILFGHIRELDEVLAGMADNTAYPDDLRYGIEALRWFRDWYRSDGELPPRSHLQRQTVAVIDTSWSAELLAILRQNTVDRNNDVLQWGTHGNS